MGNKKLLLLALITFLSAFLLFQIELIVAKLFLPHYGGSYLVWGACVVFFQAVLLLGYLWTHALIKKVGIRIYLKVHLALLVLSFLVFLGGGIQINLTTSSMPLVLDVFIRLLLTIGPVFFVLSTASLVTQSWIIQTGLEARKHPYFLYAISNIGSFLALISYPFVFEYFLPVSQQLHIWRMFYGAMLIAQVLAIRLIPINPESKKEDSCEPVTRQQSLYWLLTSAASVVLFLSVTNLITYEVAPVPLFWIIPLGIYLLSFVFMFNSKPLNIPWLNVMAGIAVCIGIGLYFESKLRFLPAVWLIILLSLVLLILCLFAQRKLIDAKPAQGNMTYFYVMISLGGFIGGFVTSWIMPLISVSSVEFLLGILLVSFLFTSSRSRWVLAAIVLMALIIEHCMHIHHSLMRKRNYYGIYEVFDNKSNVRTFLHGTTLHGLEWLNENRKSIPLGYYSPHSSLGEVLIKNIFEQRRVGVVGLGTGTIAMYNRTDTVMDFYELDSDVVDIARNYFWYLKLAPSLVNVKVGDARISLEKEKDVRYDVLIIDAFGSDSIPVHLINKDVLKLYQSRLNRRGGVFFHIPNRFFNLEPVIARIAHDCGALAAVKETVKDGITMATIWSVVTWDQGRFLQLISSEGWRPIEIEDYKPMRTWDDDFSTPLAVFKFDYFWEGLKHFKLF